MHPRYFRSCLFFGISLVLLIGTECKSVQVRSVVSQQPARCMQDRPRSGRLTCSDETKLKRYFFHPSKPKGCKKFAICPSTVVQQEASINDTEDNYFLDFKSCQMKCMIHIQCPELLESRVHYSAHGLQTWGKKVTYECYNGYSLSKIIRRRERICQKNGTWSGEPPVCLQQCQDPPAISHANIAPAKDLHNQGSTVHYACDVGYGLEGNSQRTCGEGGEWVEPEPRCVCAVTQMNGKCPNCHEPSPIENGQVTAPNRSINAVIQYTCNEQYILIGNSSRYCLEDSVWSGQEPICWKVNIVMGESGSAEREDVTNKTATVNAGSKRVVFQAIATDPNPFKSEWLFNGEKTLPHALDSTGQLLTFITILKSKEQDGNYTILLGGFSASFTLNISDPESVTSTLLPTIMNDVPMNIIAHVGSLVDFNCIASGESTVPNLTWYHNNATISSGERRIILVENSDTLAIGFLLISQVEIGDQGQYHCSAENIAGRVSSAAVHLSIGESPARRFAEEGTGMSSLCSQKSADAVIILGRVRKARSNLDLIKRYTVHIKQVLRSSSKMEALGSNNSIRTILLGDVLVNKEGTLKANRDYVFQGRLLVGKILLVSGDNVYQYTPSLQRHLVSC